MKRFVLFAILIVALDQTIGFVLKRLYLRTTSGEAGGLINCALRHDPDVLVLGSSRAKHHVSPAILRARLSASVFNAGINGQDFLYAIMLLDLWTRSHAPPKAILLHVDLQSLSRSENELDRTSVFSAYFGESERVRSILLTRGKYEWLKYLSSSYRFNGKVLPIIKNLASRPDEAFDGYIGLEGSLAPGSAPVTHSGNGSNWESVPFWDLKLGYLDELARYCKANGTRLLLFHSPIFQEDPAALAAWSTRLSALHLSQEGIEFLDLAERTRELLAGRPYLFKDNFHLNSKGAEIFSTILADEIAARIGPIATGRK
jgi:hypothetical protein